MVAKIFIDGEAGTTGLQIRDRLLDRVDIELLSIPAEKRKDLGARTDLLNAADIAILCLPDDAARESVNLITNDTTRVIDASTAFRIATGWAYGFAEMSQEQSSVIATAKRVANPGCYPQGVIATLRPLLAAGLLPRDIMVSVNAISGYSGGGRQMIESYEAQGAGAPVYFPYGLGLDHKHVPEMTHYAGLENAPLFQPVVGNFKQGMLDAIPLQLGGMENAPCGAQLHAALADYYAGIKDSFVEVAPYEAVQSAPELDPQIYNNSNKMRLYVFANDARRQAILMAVYDNLGKGASGAAVQNLNLMLGVDPKTGL